MDFDLRYRELNVIHYFLDSVSEESDLPITGLLCHPKSLVNSLAVLVSAAIWAILDPTLEPHLRVVRLLKNYSLAKKLAF